MKWLGQSRRLARLTAVMAQQPAPVLLALMYGCLVLVGASVLAAPISHHGEVGLMEALFTAASAVTVTGLVVVDTGSAFTPFGQVIIAVLIQCGGLGLMTFAVLLLSAIGMPIGIPQRVMLREDMNQTSISDLVRLTRIVLRLAIICELIGAALLAFVFVPEYGWLDGLWSAVFHSISAFNNAGFSLYPDSVSRWVANPIINIVIPLMFILGGLGFAVIGDVVRERRWRTLSLHSKIMLSGTGVLIVVSFAAFAALEWRNPGTLGALEGTGARLWASWFQAVTTRTAGFNSLDIGALHDSTSTMFIALMVIGGGSTSTAGGIKVTTFVVLILATIAFFKRRSTLRAFGRSIALEEVLKVMALVTLSVLIMFIATFMILISHDGEFLDLTFEVASAFGTVGLSRGATGELDTFGQLIIIMVMFLGRVGPLTIGFFLATRSTPRIRYPSGRIFLG